MLLNEIKKICYAILGMVSTQRKIKVSLFRALIGTKVSRENNADEPDVEDDVFKPFQFEGEIYQSKAQVWLDNLPEKPEPLEIVDLYVAIKIEVLRNAHEYGHEMDYYPLDAEFNVYNSDELTDLCKSLRALIKRYLMNCDYKTLQHMNSLYKAIGYDYNNTAVARSYAAFLGSAGQDAASIASELIEDKIKPHYAALKTQIEAKSNFARLAAECGALGEAIFALIPASLFNKTALDKMDKIKMQILALIVPYLSGEEKVIAKVALRAPENFIYGLDKLLRMLAEQKLLMEPALNMYEAQPLNQFLKPDKNLQTFLFYFEMINIQLERLKLEEKEHLFESGKRISNQGFAEQRARRLINTSLIDGKIVTPPPITGAIKAKEAELQGLIVEYFGDFILDENKGPISSIADLMHYCTLQSERRLCSPRL